MTFVSKFTDEEIIAAVQKYGSNQKAAAALGMGRRSVDQRMQRIKRKQEADPVVAQAASAIGADDTLTVSHGWRMVKDEHGNGFSVFFKNHQSGETHSFADIVKAAIDDALEAKAPKFEPRKQEPSGDYLLVVDLADVHFDKLCVASETSFEYNLETARHRVIEGTKALLRRACAFGVHRILFVMGNDILNTDNGKTTTSGTGQDTLGSFFNAYRAASAAYKEAISLCAGVADVDLIHCMSNHDWRAGWMLAQEVAAWFQNHPNINATEYNLSERHRKYYGYGNNALQITHGDGAKPEALLQAFHVEAKHLIAKCDYLYSLQHHFHSKTKQKRGLDVFTSEKDHLGFTAIKTGHANVMGTHINIEYVRSPSPPDGWHDRNGYINRQAVECFLYHPETGQDTRFTEWF